MSLNGRGSQTASHLYEVGKKLDVCRKRFLYQIIVFILGNGRIRPLICHQSLFVFHCFQIT